ncbi:MAG TPA: alkaline phosphatase D family protein [Kribbella sp.]
MQLRLGPLLRFVDETRATVWVETSGPCEVEILGHRAPTWSVHGHHYALVLIEGLRPASTTEYEVRLNGDRVWPLEDNPYGPSVIRTARADESFRLTFGSCRRSAPLDEEGIKEFGPDALVALAERMAEQMAEQTDPLTAGDDAAWPDALLLLGDQVYADDPSDAVLAKLRAAHGGREGSEVQDEIGNFEEYTWLYDDAWLDPAVRWLFSTAPLCMLLDDHDLRDDWNTSMTWRRWVTSQPWWHDRVVGAYGSYWVYQHLGNLSPEQLEKDPTYAAMRALDNEDERSSYLDAFAWEADEDPASTRWSFYRDFGARSLGVRLVAVDSRCSRQLEPGERAMVDAHEWEWVRRHTVGATQPINHLLFASTLPFLLPPGLHHLEGWDEAISSGAWGSLGARIGEKFRQRMDLEHWASFRRSFDDVTDLLTELVRGEDPPASVLMLSGDVHCSYLAQARLTTEDHPGTAIHQLTMSPFRNPIGKHFQLAFRFLGTRLMTALLHKLARSARVRDVAADWRTAYGPWFGNGVMTITVSGEAWAVQVDHAEVFRGRQRLKRTLTFGG